jgi:hypothetical protein
MEISKFSGVFIGHILEEIKIFINLQYNLVR